MKENQTAQEKIDATKKQITDYKAKIKDYQMQRNVMKLIANDPENFQKGDLKLPDKMSDRLQGIVDKIKDKDVQGIKKEAFWGHVEAVEKIVGNGINIIDGYLDLAKHKVNDIKDSIIDKFKNLIDKFCKWVGNQVDKVIDFAKGIGESKFIKGIKEWVNDKIIDPVENFLKEVNFKFHVNVTDKINEKFDALEKTLEPLQKMVDKLAEKAPIAAAKNAVKHVSEAAAEVGNQVEKAGNNLIGQVNNIGKGIKNKILGTSVDSNSSGPKSPDKTPNNKPQNTKEAGLGGS